MTTMVLAILRDQNHGALDESIAGHRSRSAATAYVVQQQRILALSVASSSNDTAYL